VREVEDPVADGDPDRGAAFPPRGGRSRTGGSGWGSRCPERARTPPRSGARDRAWRRASWRERVGKQTECGEILHGLLERAGTERAGELGARTRDLLRANREPRHVMASPSTRNAAGSRSSSNGATSAVVGTVVQQRRREEHVEEPVHGAPRAVRRIGQRILAAQRVVQPGGRLERDAVTGTGGEEAQHVRRRAGTRRGSPHRCGSSRGDPRAASSATSGAGSSDAGISTYTVNPASYAVARRQGSARSPARASMVSITARVPCSCVEPRDAPASSGPASTARRHGGSAPRCGPPTAADELVQPGGRHHEPPEHARCGPAR
jgi:hypothetical protein